MNGERSTLIIAWGNQARLDDGLGPAFADTIATERLSGVTIDSGYQLQVEDAADVAGYDRVLFVDADRKCDAPFRLERVRPSKGGISFSTHSVTPEAILELARDLFRAEPEAWILGIRGYDFDDFGEFLSPGARDNLTEAVLCLREAVETDTLREIRQVVASHRRESEVF